MKIMIINGPNMNMLGIREKDIYGKESYDSLIEMIQKAAGERKVETVFFQSNHEGDLVDWIQSACFEEYDGIVINPGAYTHTSLAIADAARAIKPIPVVEVHISDISQRESYRQVSYISEACIAQIRGHGFAGYVEAMDEIIKYNTVKNSKI